MINSEEQGEKVKSTAIVKYSVPKPAQYTKLECNTDLKLPPSNWLSSSADSYGLQHVLHNHKGFSSFQMAHMFPDCVGEVDVVSDAENIKNLLKIPYSKGHISMMVHRVENTLLLDDFDIYTHLLKTTESEWQWLKKFFFENISHATCEEDRSLYIKNRRREALQQKSLVSKFLYHSLAEGEQGIEGERTLPIPLQEPRLPDPDPATPDPMGFSHNYNRNVVWTFEDIEMLIGTDLPIFGGGTHPCISLRLRDVSKPINVLTGIDYWLDNLMSNVPEVVMCYHLNGIVQKYELVKTEDLPRLDNSKFSPKLIRDVAQSILSFLKSNATKAGHTYWLFKGKDEEVVKLYDLTSLCNERDVESQNPFTIPVAMLLYRVARNMKHSSHRHQPGTIRTLLKNCVDLLPETQYPEIVTSSHYMLSDLYLPADTVPEAPGLETMDTDENDSVYEDDEIISSESGDSSTKVLPLNCLNGGDQFAKHYVSPPPIQGTVEERCFQALHHVTSGLNCLQYFRERYDSRDEPEEEMKMSKPDEAIPMPYPKMEQQPPQQKSKKSGRKRDKPKKSNKDSEEQSKETSLIPKNSQETVTPLPTWQEQHGLNISWKVHLKILLYEKAILTYATLSEQNYTHGNYGHGLRTMALLARCQIVMNHLHATSSGLKENYLLNRAGDCCLMMVQNWTRIESYREQYQSNAEEDVRMMEQLEKDEQLYKINIGLTRFKCIFLYDLRTIEQMLLKTAECYEEALKSNESDSTLRSLANSLNEIGTLYLNRAKCAENTETAVETCRQAEPYLNRSLSIFERIRDDSNTALVYANRGHMHRLLAHVHAPVVRMELTPLERAHYNKAVVNYKRALQVLAEKKHSPAVWDAVQWELSTVLYNLGVIMHEFPKENCTKTEAEKSVLEVFQTALQYCTFEEDNPKLPLYQFRAAQIYWRIACLYHSHILTTPDSTNRKNAIQLAKINYEKCARLYKTIMENRGYLTAQLQLIALSEHLAESTNVQISKLKHFRNALNVFTDIGQVLEKILETKSEIPDSEKVPVISCSTNFSTLHALFDLIRERLQCTLKMLVKLCLHEPPITKDCPKWGAVYKSCYVTSFKLKAGLPFDQLLTLLTEVCKEVSGKLQEYKEKID